MSGVMLRQLCTALLIFVSVRTLYGQCGNNQYKRCVMLADPLLRNPQLIYPDNLKDINLVCRTWSQFVDCVTQYTNLCFTEKKQKEFNKAVENPLDLVNEMCTSLNYQKQYLKHAPCMRATLMSDSHCGRHYTHLVSQVSSEPATPALCCSNLKFQECLLNQTQKLCNKDAYPFAKQVLNKAMGFLQEQCQSYSSDPNKCPESEFYTSTVNKVSIWSDMSPTVRMIPDSQTDNWSDNHHSTVNKFDSMTHTRETNNLENPSTRVDNVSNNTRTAHSRGRNWNPSTNSVLWRVSGGLSTEPSLWTQDVRSTTVSNMLVDEPNQQGLSNENNVPSLIKSRDHLPVLGVVLLLYLCSTFS